MIAALPQFVWSVDALVVLGTGWLIARAAGQDGGRLLESGLSALLASVMVVTGAGIVTGAIGAFSLPGFFAAHLLIAGAVGFARRTQLRSDVRAASALVQLAIERLCRREAASLAALALLVLLVALGAIATFAQPQITDALTYHLPRVGFWLQEHRVGFIPTPDARMNFVADGPEIVTAWLLGATNAGYRPAVLAQAFGGLLLVGATIGLARKIGLRPPAAVFAGALLLGMQNVATQFTAAQTDLFAAGIFAAAFFLWWCAAERNEVGWLGAAGVGLAVGAKGTLFYFAPTVLLFSAYIVWRTRVPVVRWAAALGVLVAATAAFAGPLLARNWSAYGNPFAPAEWREKAHGRATNLSELGTKLRLNLWSTVAQTFIPPAQPHVLRPATTAVAERLIERLPDDDPFTFEGRPRRSELRRVLHWPLVDSDATAFGAVAFGLFVLGFGFALVQWRRPGAGAVVLGSTGVILFIIILNAEQVWHPFAFRYFVLAAPWVALSGAWLIEQFGAIARRFAWTLVLLATLDVLGTTTLASSGSGWQSVTDPRRSEVYAIYEGWSGFMRDLDHPDAPVTVAVAGERPVAGFLRNGSGQRVVLTAPLPPTIRTAEQALAGTRGWIIVPAARFIGREGNAVGRVWLYGGDEQSPFSIAAYRRRGAADQGEPLVYRHQIWRAQAAVIHDLVINPGDHAHIAVVMKDVSAAVSAKVFTPDGPQRCRIDAGGAARLDVALEPNTASAVRVVLAAETGAPLDSDGSVTVSP